jgi:hypothetical protein
VAAGDVMNFWDRKKKSDRNFFGISTTLVLAAIFAPERYSILVFLGAIWVSLFEISERLMNAHTIHSHNAECLSKLANGK